MRRKMTMLEIMSLTLGLLLLVVACSSKAPTATLSATNTSRPTNTPAPTATPPPVTSVARITVVPSATAYAPASLAETPTPTATAPTPIPTAQPGPVGWVPQDSGVTNDLSAVHCLNNKTCFAVGSESTILKTTNGGAEWVLKDAGVRPGLYLEDVDCPDSDTCYAVSHGSWLMGSGETARGNALIVKTMDGGEVWSEVGTGDFPFLNGITCPACDTCYVVSDYGNLFKTSDGGSSWSRQTVDPAGSRARGEVHCLNEYACHMVAGSASVFITTDGGTNWVELEGEARNGLTAIHCPTDSATCYAMTYNEILKTSDGGASWTTWRKHQGDETNHLAGLHCVDNSTCYAVAGSGIIYKTTDGGETWRGGFRRPDLRVPLNDIQCPESETICYAVGLQGTILKTTDGGASPPSGWEPWSLGADVQLVHIDCPVKGEICYGLALVTGEDESSFGSAVLKTTDGWETWSTLTPQGDSIVYDLDCPDGVTCYALGGSPGAPPTVLLTKDGGHTWSTRDPDPALQGLEGITCPDHSSCYGLLSDYSGEIAVSEIVKTEDMGETWSPVFTETQAFVTSIHCPVDGDTCYALSNDFAFTEEEITFVGDVLKTEDGGTTWSTVYGAEALLVSLHCPADDDTCFVVGGGLVPGWTEASFLKTEDGGKSWSSLSSGFQEVLYDIHCPTALTCFVAAGCGTVLKTADGGSTWSVQYLGTQAQIQGITCLDEDICLAVDSDGTILKTTSGGDAGPSSALPIDIQLPTPTRTPGPAPTPTPPPFELLTVVDNFNGVDLIFDGEHIWASSTLGGSVIKLGLVGTVLHTTAAGSATGLTFDGKNVWVALGGVKGRVGKLAPDGAFVGIYDVGSSPRGLLFDGESIWVANLDDPSVTRLALDGTVLGTYTGGAEPGPLLYESLAFDGEHLWLASSFSDVVTKLSRDGQNLGTFSVGEGSHDGIAFDGESIWVTNYDSLTKLALDGREIGTFEVGGSPQALLFDGGSIWVGAEDFVIRLALDGTELGRFPVDGWPQALAFDGTSVWMANSFGGTGDPIQKLTLSGE